MNFLKRALLYIWRKKHRSIVLMMTVFAMASFVLTGLVLRSGAEREAAAVREALGSSFVLKIDNNDMSYYEPGDFAGSLVYAGPMVTQNIIDRISDMEEVTDYFIDAVQGCWTNLELKPGLFTYEMENYDPEYPNRLTPEGYDVLRHSADVIACNDGERQEFFRMGACSIAEGRNIQEGDRWAAVISEYVAEKNHVTVGDTFRLETKEGCAWDSDTPEKTVGVPMEVEIVGIFKINFEQEATNDAAEFRYAENLIFSTWDVVEQIVENWSVEGRQEGYSKATFFVDDPAHLETVMERVRSDMSPEIEGLLLEWDDTVYQATTDPLNGMLLLSNLLIFAGAAGCVIILALLVRMWVKTRKREVGILLSAGVRRGEILLQMASECLIPAAAAVILALLLSGYLSAAFCDFAEEAAFANSGEAGYTVGYETGADVLSISQVGAERVYGDYTVSGETAGYLFLTVGIVTVGSAVLAAQKTVRMQPQRLLQSY